MLLEEGDQLLEKNKVIFPPQRNAAEIFNEALKINPGNEHAESKLENISYYIADSIKQLINKNRLDEAENLLVTVQQYFPANNLFSNTLDNRIKIKKLEGQADEILNKDPIEAFNICDKIKNLDPNNSFVISLLPRIKDNLTGMAEREFKSGNYKSALNDFTRIRNYFGEDRHVNEMITKISSKTKESSDVKVPNLIGLTIKQAKNILKENNLQSGNILEIASSEQNKGKVINQIPNAAVKAQSGTKVNLIIGK